MTQEKSRKVTIAEVARLAGVGTATAGRVLGGYGYSSEDVRNRVHKSARQLGYKPNQLARSLITGVTKTIGVVAGDIQSPFYSSVLRGIYDISRAEGFGILLTGSDEEPQKEIEAVELLIQKQVDGLIVAPSQLSGAEHLQAFVATGKPLVQIDRIVEGLDTDAVTVDNVTASRRCTAELIAVGHRRIGIVAELEWWQGGNFEDFIAGVLEGSVSSDHLFPSWQRLLGYLQAHLEAGVSVDPALVARVGTYSIDAATAAIASCFRHSAPPTAFFSTDGLMSAALMGVLKAERLSIPQDVSLVCFDDLDWMQFHEPTISAVVQPTREVGETAARLVLDRIADATRPPRVSMLKADLILRGSIQPPANSV
ncbi:LacI family DNA-binding transcriptional regulator [Nitratireductor aquibiodomus]|uniref:Alanine racemase n=1 Tax=Nitratireductor aquibiodomus RA22 TaxID=1189611 RepID=I5BS58_9HYPH|nr:LacI family DNA-binding transcriptional regulator [Nitratireductor aquibiodomus]EIM72410.1 alanine racemase [Nitratireductor aquibiodomus RA22]